MAPDPEKPMEGLLRRYARKRRERAGEPWTVDPVTRRLLQEEVARRFPKKRTFGSGLREFRGWMKPVLAVAGAAAVIVLGFVLFGPNGRTDKSSTTDVISSRSAKVLVKDQPTSQLATASGTGDSNHFFTVADNSPSSSRDRALREGLQSPAPAENMPAQEKQEAAQAAPPALALAENKRDQTVSAPAEASVAQDAAAPSAAAAVSGASSGLAGSPQNNPSQSSAQASQKTSGNVASFARAESDLALGKTARAKPVVMQYGLFNASQTPLVAPMEQRQALARSAQISSVLGAQPSGNAQRVLTSFNVEQAGRELRVIDSDGSVYAGPMQPTNTLEGTFNQDRRGLAGQAISKKAIQSRLASKESETPPAGSSFQLTGTNRTLNRRVVFQGVLTTNQPLLTGRRVAQSERALSGTVDGSQTSGSVQPVNGSSQTNQSVGDLHLSGTAEIEGEPPVRIEASPVSK